MSFRERYRLIQLIKSLVPPLVYDLCCRFLDLLLSQKYGFLGDYKSYEEALAASSGYEADEVVEHLRSRELARIESESFLSNEISVRDQQFIAALGIMFSSINGFTRLLDFGGGLGSHFRLAKRFFGSKIESWVIVETKALSSVGQELYTVTEKVVFKNKIELPSNEKFNIVIAIGALQCTDDPLRWFKDLEGLNSDWMYIDRLPLVDSTVDRLTVQNSYSYQKGSYPSWFLSREKWESIFSKEFTFEAKWKSDEEPLVLDGRQINMNGFLLRRKK